MSKDVSRAYGHGVPPTSLGMSLFGEGESDDSFLREVLQDEPAPRLPVPGEQLGGMDGRRYNILGWMGGGGMGQVFRARDEVLGREVALKFLVSRQGLEGAVLNEARAVALLDHENIVRIFDVSEWRGTPGGRGIPFLVMECLEGESLAALLKRGPPEVSRALEILEGIAAGLAHAHERHLVHRDLKPGNVFLTRQGTVKLLDFGLSQLTPACVARKPELATAGTPAYMAPEQWRGEPQDARTDIWAVGALLHELLTGGLPFPGATLEELQMWVTCDEPVPPVRARRPEVPREVESLLATALAKDPARRFRTALELRAELNEVRARLRLECEAPRNAERHQLTLVTFLLTGLTDGAAPLDAEDVVEVALAFHETCAEVVGQHGGFVALSMGGEVLACFGCPQSREDDSERAVRAGLQLTRELRDTLQHKLPHLSLSGLVMRAGIHTDWVTVRMRALDSRVRGGLAVQGDAPRVAELLARQARPGGVLIGETTWRLVRGAFLTESLGSHVFEGLSGSVSLEAHHVLGKRKVSSRFDQSLGTGRLSPLVGREPELARLLELWERTWRGQGGFVLVSGEAGIGKSRLIEELCERVASESALLLRVQCWFRFSAHAQHPAIALLQDVARFNPEDTPPQRLRKLEERLGALGLPTEDTHLLGQLLSLPVPEDSPVHTLTPERRKERIFEALARILLHTHCCEVPVLLVVEDLHWADSTHLEFLGFLLERVEQGRLLVVLSSRPELRPAWPWRPWFHRLPLERLSTGLAATLVKEVAQGRELPEETVQRLVSRTDGIPLFIEEMTRMVLEGGTEASIPVTLHELLLARLDLLPSRQRALAQLCAVVGRDFPRALIAALVDVEDFVLARELAALVEAGLLQEEPGAEGGEPGYRFRHALIQDAAYQSLFRSTRRRHHRHIARVLEERFARLTMMKPELLAHHYTEAGEVAPAIHHWLRAGQLANQRSAFQEAMNHLTLARELLPGLTDAHQRLRAELSILSYLCIPMAYLRGYDSPELERLFRQLREIFYQMDGELPQVELCYWAILAYSYARSELSRVWELGGMLVDTGESQHSQELLSVGHRMTATILFSWGRMREAEEHVEQAMVAAPRDVEQLEHLAIRHGSEPMTCALGFAALITSVRGQPDKARRHTREALELAGRITHPLTRAYALMYAAMACQVRHEVREALAWAERAFEASREHNYWTQAWALLIQGWCVSELGSPREGTQLIRQGLERARRSGVRCGLPGSQGLLTESLMRLGEFQEAQGVVDEALRMLETSGERDYEVELHRLYGELLRASGREREAKQHFARAIAVAREQGAGLYELRATVGLSRLLWGMGRPKVAGRLLARACARFEAGGESVDLQEARALLEVVRAGGAVLALRELHQT